MPEVYVSDDDLRAMIWALIARGESQVTLARRWGISQAYLSQFLARKRGLTYANEDMIRGLGYDPTPNYRKLTHERRQSPQLRSTRTAKQRSGRSGRARSAGTAERQ